MIGALRAAFGSRSDLAIVLCVVGILFVLFFPIPKQFLDFLLILNFSFGLLILLLTFYTDKPLGFSTFPSLLLIATLFRLSLNVAATRLILSQADAGKVIATIGKHVVAGNFVIGLVVFLILIVVQYVVVTSGAQRVAEVAARFTLDAMPGKQMSIDAELNMGLIDEAEAKRRRSEVEKEANFYGAMDGASKFVKGDAIAGIVIILINIIGGLSVGMIQRGLGWKDALNLYTLLTVGDGIVTQIPALIIATATGIIVTRAATDARLSEEIGRQVSRHPKSLLITGSALLLALMVPGIPAVPVLALLGLNGALVWAAFRTQAKSAIESVVDVATARKDEQDGDLRSVLLVDPIEISFGDGLLSLLGQEDGPLLARVQVLRKQFAMDLGFILPKVKVRGGQKRGSNDYEVRIYGAKVANGTLIPDRILAINPGGERIQLPGISGRDPTFGLRATWIAEADIERARHAGYTVVDPITVLITHFNEIVKAHAADLLSRTEMDLLLGRVRERNPALMEELVPNVLTFGEIQRVLQNLLKERIPIRNLDLIIEVLLDQGRQTREPELLTEVVRERLGRVICDRLGAQDGALHVLTLDPRTEERLRSGLRAVEKQSSLVLDPSVLEALLKRLSQKHEEMMLQNLMPVLLCPPVLRRHLKRLTERVLPHLSVLSLNEVPNTKTVKAFGMVDT